MVVCSGDYIFIVEMGFQVCCVVNGDIENCQMVQNYFMDWCRVFIDIISEGDCVQMVVQVCCVVSNVFCQVVIEYVYCVSCFFFLVVVVFNEMVVRSYFSQI